MTTKWLTGWLVAFFLVLVMVFVTFILVADMLGRKIAGTAEAVTAEGRQARLFLSNTERQLDQLGHMFVKTLEKSDPKANQDDIGRQFVETMTETIFDEGPPIVVYLDLYHAAGYRTTLLYEDAGKGDGLSPVDSGQAADRFDLPAVERGLPQEDVLWAETGGEVLPDGNRRTRATLFRMIGTQDVSGHIAVAFDAERIAGKLSAKMPGSNRFWVLQNSKGELIACSLPEEHEDAPSAKPLRNTGLAPDNLGLPGTDGDVGGVAALIRSVDAVSRQIGFYRGRTKLNSEDVYVFPAEVGNGWRFIAIYPSGELFSEQIDIMRLFTVITVLTLALALLTGLMIARRTSADLTRLTGAVEQLKPEGAQRVGIHELNTLLDDPALSGTGELAFLARSIRDAWSGLVVRNDSLEAELEKNRTLAGEISRFYSHVRVLNGQDFRIDFFEYHAESDRFLFLTGLATLLGDGSQIFRDMGGTEFFERFNCRLLPSESDVSSPADASGMDFRKHAEQTDIRRNAEKPTDPAESHRDFRRGILRCLSGSGSFSVEFSASGEQDAPLWLRCWGRPDVKEGKVSGALLDISREVRQRSADRNRLLADGITEFYNRNALSEIGGHVLNSREPGELIAFVYFGLKTYQDFELRFGMMSGNAYIRAFADLLRESVSEQQILFRWWGADFLCIVRGLKEFDDIRRLGEKVLKDLSSARRSVNGITADFPLVAGYSVAGVHGNTPAELLEYAAFAKHEVDLGQAENLNEFNRTRYDDSRQVALRRSFIRDVIERNELYVVYQPIVSLETGDVFGFEALSRPANRIYRSITELIEDAEDTGHYAVLERRMVYNALDGYMERPESCRNAWLFLNTSPVPALTEADYLDIRDRYFGFMRVVYEVIERNKMDPDEIERRKNMVRRTGAKFALDDFGSGHSNHLALLALEPDIIKIDRGLVAGVDLDIRKQQMIENIIGYARQGGTCVLAEGVETSGELAALCRMGVDYAQGFFLARPAVSFGGVATEALALIRGMTQTGRTGSPLVMPLFEGIPALNAPPG